MEITKIVGVSSTTVVKARKVGKKHGLIDG